jgi:hypothetical protein
MSPDCFVTYLPDRSRHDWRRDPDDVAVGICDHEIAVSPRASVRALQHLRSERLSASEDDVYPGVDPELRLYGGR